MQNNQLLIQKSSLFFIYYFHALVKLSAGWLVRFVGGVCVCVFSFFKVTSSTDRYIFYIHISLDFPLHYTPALWLLS